MSSIPHTVTLRESSLTSCCYGNSLWVTLRVPNGKMGT